MSKDFVISKLIRVQLPAHLRELARCDREVKVAVDSPITVRSILDELEWVYPMLGGTIRDHVTQQRRPLVRFFACGEDISHECVDVALPAAIVDGDEPLIILGAIAGG